MSNKHPKIHACADEGDAEGVLRELRAGTNVDLPHPDNRCTPLMVAVASQHASLEVVRVLIEHGANVNAVLYDKPAPTFSQEQMDQMRSQIQAQGDPQNMLEVLRRTEQMFASHQHEQPGFRTVLSIAIGQGDLKVIEFLIDRGADVRYMRPANYDALIDAVHTQNKAELIPLLRLLISRGALLNTVSTYSESAIRVASRRGQFDVVRELLQAGADPAPLEWTPFMRTIVLGTVEEVRSELDQYPDLTARDSWERTPWLLSLIVGDVEKAKLLQAAGTDPTDRGRCGATPLEYPILSGKHEMLRWLLAEGFNPNDQNEHGDTALFRAVEQNDLQSACLLLDAGAGMCNGEGDSALRGTSDPAMARLLLAHGAEIEDISHEVRAAICGLPNDGKLEVDSQTFHVEKHRRFGTSNPEKINLRFWRAMVRSGLYAYSARSRFDDESCEPPAVWCFVRFGQSLTELPDGRVIQIAGEHEDHYDPDFCIYNDVTVHHPDGSFEIYGYPEAIFPPTDFHTATLIGEHIYIIGNLGYIHDRKPGVTQVFRLDTRDLKMERLSVTGEMPGWIHSHRATKVDDHRIRVIRGEVAVERDGNLQLVRNKSEYELDIRTLRFTRVD